MNATMNDLQKHMSIVVYFLLGISIPLVGLRCYTRFRVLKSFGVDDALVVVSLVSRPDRYLLPLCAIINHTVVVICLLFCTDRPIH